MNHLRMIRIVIPILAACALLASFVSAIVSWQFIRNAKTTNGMIVATKAKLDDDGNTLYQPTFEFAVAGRNYSVTPKSYASPSPGNAGTRVPVLYDPRNPSSARIDSFHYNWALSTVTFVVAIIFGTIHFGVTWFRKRFQYIPPNAG